VPRAFTVVRVFTSTLIREANAMADALGAIVRIEIPVGRPTISDDLCTGVWPCTGYSQ
jgi:hypothetical protein